MIWSAANAERYVMKKLTLILCLLLLTVLSAGCAKGEVVMELSRLGSADIQCKLVAIPLVASQLGSVRDDFVEDGFQVEDVKEEKMEGFLAKKHFKNVSEVNQTKIMQGFKLNKNKDQAGKQAENQATATKNTNVVFTQGLLFDTVAVNTHLDLRSSQKDESKESKWLVKNLLQQVELRFVLKLPTAVDSSNASRSPDNGKTLVWDLVLGEDNELQAQVTYLNPFKAGGFALVLAVVGGFVWFRRKRAN